MSGRWSVVGFAVLAFAMLVAAALGDLTTARWRVPHGRSEVVFWHFWGGKDRPVVEAIAERFNASQHDYFVRPIAMPGNNLDLKFFLSVAGADPPDVVNQDDPVVADWASRGAITPLDELASAKEIAELEKVVANSVRQLSNEPFLAKAPEKIVAGMRQKQAEYEAQLAKLRASL